MPDIHVESLVASNTLEPRVNLKVDNIEVQLSPNEARRIAHMLLEVAEAADGDAFLVDFFTKELDTELKHIYPMLNLFRKYRNDLDKKDK